MIETLSHSALAAAEAGLIALLRDCVHAGASLGFLAPLPESDAADYWRTVAAQVAADARTVLVARDGGRIVGSGQLAYESKPNGRHRAEINKVMVLPSHRRRGIAAEIMRALEQCARDRGIRLLFLDTAEGEGGAQRFYESLGYLYAGGIPGYALDPDGRAMKNAIYYKLLA
jgi:acetyltransferase